MNKIRRGELTSIKWPPLYKPAHEIQKSAKQRISSYDNIVLVVWWTVWYIHKKCNKKLSLYEDASQIPRGGLIVLEKFTKINTIINLINQYG